MPYLSFRKIGHEQYTRLGYLSNTTWGYRYTIAWRVRAYGGHLGPPR